MSRIHLSGLRAGLWVDSDLKTDRRAVDDAIDRPFSPVRAPAALETVAELLRETAKAEFERESNLNTRAAAVAAVAGLIVTASGAVGKAVFDATGKTLTGTEGDVTVALMVVGLVALVASMLMVVMVVLRPKQAKTRQTFFTDAIVDLWTAREHSSLILCAQKDALNQLFVDRLLRTIALWSVRNRQKSRWLGRAWVLLALGIVLIGIAGLLVASDDLDYSLGTTLGMVAGGLVVVWLVLKALFHAGRESAKEEAKRADELQRIVDWLSKDAAKDVAPGAT
jgi:hypothetical protein